MKGTYTRQYEMLVRVRDFGDTHQELFPRDSPAGVAFAAVSAAVTQLADFAATEVSGRLSTREGTTSRTMAREALKADLDAIVRTARAMAVTMPGIDAKFPMPHGSDQHLLNGARAFARDAAPLAKSFVEYYLPEDFLTHLHTDIANFESATRAQENGKGIKAVAIAAIEAAIEAALQAVLQLDAFVPNKLRADPTTLAQWELARRVDRPVRARRKQATPASVPAPAPTPATAPVPSATPIPANAAVAGA